MPHNSQWTILEWDEMVKKLSSLSLDQLKELTEKVGIKFTQGTQSINNKEELILVLDEANREDLEKELEKLEF